jgi:hypothetical protein
MKPLSREERFQVLELVTEIAGEAAKNTNVVWMIEFQEELVEKLYRRMVALLEEPRAPQSVDGPADAVATATQADAAAGQAGRNVARAGKAARKAG